MYDFIIVGSGLFGCVFANLAKRKGLNCLIVERREHLFGNLYTKKEQSIDVHVYGAHIFRTSDKTVWDYVNQFGEFNNFINCPVANYKGRLFNLPFNMNTFHQMWPDVITPDQAIARIDEQRAEIQRTPRNLEEHAISLVGRDIFKTLIKEYTEKQWGRDCKDLPASIMRRLPVRLTFDNNYFNDRYQGVPVDGYSALLEKMIKGVDTVVGHDFNEDRELWMKMGKQVIYTGTIDSFFDYKYGPLEYRGLHFEHKTLNCSNYQGVAVMNFTDRETPYTRVIEHKHFNFGQQPNTVVSYEYPASWSVGEEPYYPINDERNDLKYSKYKELAESLPQVHFGGRLGEYKYFDMQDTIKSAFALAKTLFGE